MKCTSLFKTMNPTSPESDGGGEQARVQIIMANFLAYICVCQPVRTDKDRPHPFNFQVIPKKSVPLRIVESNLVYANLVAMIDI